MAPTLLAYGTAEQRERFLPPIRVGEALWCQGYSEPGAGSDLANVQTRAVRDGDEWVITGQKIWTSHANWADWCFALCRTNSDAPKHRGLSYILVPMRQPGIEVRPISQMTGTSEFSEVFFSEARAKVVAGEGLLDWGEGATKRPAAKKKEEDAPAASVTRATVVGGTPGCRLGYTAQRLMGVDIDSWGTKSNTTSSEIGDILV